MKIRNEHLRTLQENEARRAKAQQPSGVFTELFTRELDAEQISGPTGLEISLTQTQGSQAVVFSDIQEGAADGDAAHTVEQAVARMDGMFDAVEQYAERLTRDDPAEIKHAYGLLQNLNGQIEGFKSQFPHADGEMPELASLLNELDVLAATETFKLNRGDYA